MKILYRELGLTAKDVAEVTATVIEIITKKLPDPEAINFLKEKYKENKLHFGLLLLGRVAGMSFALSNPEKVKAILSDFLRLISIYKSKGKEQLTKVIEKETLEEVYSKLDELKDVI